MVVDLVNLALLLEYTLVTDVAVTALLDALIHLDEGGAGGERTLVDTKATNDGQIALVNTLAALLVSRWRADRDTEQSVLQIRAEDRQAERATLIKPITACVDTNTRLVQQRPVAEDLALVVGADWIGDQSEL